MLKTVENLKHLLEESEELLMSIFYDGIYHFLVYNKKYNMMLYFQAEKSINGGFIRANEDVVFK